MGIFELILLLIGILIFIVSFMIPVKKEEMEEASVKVAEEEIRLLVEKEIEQSRDKIMDIVEGTTEQAVDKAERTMERISNEKIMAVNEYSDTVLEEIHKNHQEVVFMYDMLNDKQTSLKDTVAKADQDVKSIMKEIQEKEESFRKEDAEATETVQEPFVPLEMQPVPLNAVPMNAEEIKPEPEKKPKSKTKAKKTAAKGRKSIDPVPMEPAKSVPKPKQEKESAPASKPSKKESPKQKEEPGEINSNDKILSMYRQGMTQVEIAKELGLGVGEVKLVIDLFEGEK